MEILIVHDTLLFSIGGGTDKTTNFPASIIGGIGQEAYLPPWRLKSSVCSTEYFSTFKILEGTRKEMWPFLRKFLHWQTTAVPTDYLAEVNKNFMVAGFQRHKRYDIGVDQHAKIHHLATKLFQEKQSVYYRIWHRWRRKDNDHYLRSQLEDKLSSKRGVLIGSIWLRKTIEILTKLTWMNWETLWLEFENL